MNQIQTIIQKSNLPKEKADVLTEKFSEYAAIAAEWKARADAIVITSEFQTEEMAKAREERLFLRKKRTAIEAVRKELKEGALREGQAIDAIAKALTELIEPIEKDLLAKEDFAKIEQEKRKQKLAAERNAILEPYKEFVPVGVDIGALPEDRFEALVKYAKTQHTEAMEAQRVADAVAKQKEIEAAKKDAEIVRLKAENAKLSRGVTFPTYNTSPAEDPFYVPAVNAATDFDVLCAFSSYIGAIVIPDVKGEEAKRIMVNTGNLLKKTSIYVKEQANRINQVSNPINKIRR